MGRSFQEQWDVIRNISSFGDCIWFHAYVQRWPCHARKKSMLLKIGSINIASEGGDFQGLGQMATSWDKEGW